MSKADTWKPLNEAVRTAVAKLRVLDGPSLEVGISAALRKKKPAVDAGRLPANVQSGGDDVMAAGVLGKNALRGQGEERTRRASANRGDGALIGGIVDPHTDSEIHIVGIPPAPGRAIANAPTLKSGRDSIR